MKTDDIDMTVLRRLQTLLKDKFPDALQMSLTNTQAYIDQIGAAIAAGEYDQARAMAHKIVSSAGTFGLLPVVAQARAIEYGSADCDSQAWRALWQALQQDFAVSSDAANRFQTSGQA